MNKKFKSIKKANAIALSAAILLGVSTPVCALEKNQGKKCPTKMQFTSNDNAYILSTLKTNSKVLDAVTSAPATFQISKDNWDGSPNYTISMDLWHGTNGDLWKLYENGKLVKEVKLVNNSPNAQHAEVKFTDKRNGTYKYTAELINTTGVTKSQNTIVHEVTKNDKPIEVPLPESVSGEPAVGYTVLNEDDTSFEWAVFISNPNKKYVWEGSSFSLWGMSFETDNEITSVSNAASYKQNGKNVVINTKQEERFFPYNTTRIFVVKGKKNSSKAPANFKSNLIRGEISYPTFASLPSSFVKNKPNLNENDLIANKDDYYNPKIKVNTGNKLMYDNPASSTQLIIPLPKKMPVPVNGVDGLRIWMPSKYLAMGIGTGTEYFGLNPNFMIGLSIKENFTCGLAPLKSGYTENIVTVDGEDWSWPIQKKHPDGPFQQEKGNFNEIKKQYPDYFPDSAEHGNYVTLKTGEPDDPSYVHAAMSSYMSLTMTRELLYAIPNNDFKGCLNQCKDPWAEFVLVDNAYNRGVYGLLQRKLFTEHRDQLINSSDINKEFNLSGFANHIENIENVIKAMDSETENFYDAEITWSDMENYFKELRLYYGRNIPSDDEWNAMKEDVKKAYDVLSKHWGGDHVSLRYDFLTLLRVCEKHLPENKQPAPSGPSWIEQINSANNIG
ncbi:chitinase N-terminal domain-containing protein [Clostridium sp. MB40-C1]|uniref:chitinase N-terminal domain-containing protein n=1 Tax=Clostridium sp. MB40-C1 TaxID=3070996 RepID=UPI0027E12EC0|nr:chitinase N-terminal domain-containing protein [Clostridium sp. MB40-C1]WMJ81712.1 chitinase N-terminal domain-containing protein [Clostridium sp. MB40-C1]